LSKLKAEFGQLAKLLHTVVSACVLLLLMFRCRHGLQRIAAGKSCSGRESEGTQPVEARWWWVCDWQPERRGHSQRSASRWWQLHLLWSIWSSRNSRLLLLMNK